MNDLKSLKGVSNFTLVKTPVNLSIDEDQSSLKMYL